MMKRAAMLLMVTSLMLGNLLVAQSSSETKSAEQTGSWTQRESFIASIMFFARWMDRKKSVSGPTR